MSSSRRLIAAAAVACLGLGLTFLVLGSAGTHAGGIFASRGLYLAYLLLIGCADDCYRQNSTSINQILDSWTLKEF